MGFGVWGLGFGVWGLGSKASPKKLPIVEEERGGEGDVDGSSGGCEGLI